MPWEFDPNHSLIEMRAKHLGITTAQGIFSVVKVVDLHLDEEDITRSRFTACIEASSLDFHYEPASKMLRSEAHLDAERYPEITFRTERIEPHGGQYAIIGDLNLHGVTREIAFDGTYNGEVKDHWGNARRGYSLTTLLNLKDFDVPGSGLAGDTGETVRVNLEIELINRDGASTQPG